MKSTDEPFSEVKDLCHLATTPESSTIYDHAYCDVMLRNKCIKTGCLKTRQTPVSVNT